MKPLVRQIRIGTLRVAPSSEEGVEPFGVVVTERLLVMAAMGRITVNAVVQNVNINVQKGSAEKGRRAKDLDTQKALRYFQNKESHEIHDCFEY